ncbi:hypothetical protein [uncultured Mucilaginibacter sp.]|uniref:hypothetical protein n=1 Tax=uncultured Mucilaginibacter sp. TaxID=797541 RepID=UPI00260273F7|nr:hypothetical protein [uncultured Mucilaginibacter sp.]
MGIFNGFIVIPVLLQNLTLPFYAGLRPSKGSVHAVPSAGILLALAAISVIKLIKMKKNAYLTLSPQRNYRYKNSMLLLPCNNY